MSIHMSIHTRRDLRSTCSRMACSCAAWSHAAWCRIAWFCHQRACPLCHMHHTVQHAVQHAVQHTIQHTVAAFCGSMSCNMSCNTRCSTPTHNATQYTALPGGMSTFHHMSAHHASSDAASTALEGAIRRAYAIRRIPVQVGLFRPYPSQYPARCTPSCPS